MRLEETSPPKASWSHTVTLTVMHQLCPGRRTRSGGDSLTGAMTPTSRATSEMLTLHRSNLKHINKNSETHSQDEAQARWTRRRERRGLNGPARRTPVPVPARGPQASLPGEEPSF